MNKTEEKIIQSVEEHREDFIAFFQELARIPSITGDEKTIGDALYHGMIKRGFKDIEIVERIPGHPNVIGYLHGQEKGPSYFFNGHLDVLPPQDASDWKYPPYGGVIQDGKIYGRGTVDMKGGTFGSFFAGLVISKLNLPLKGRVVFTAVCDEQKAGDNGTLYLIDQGYFNPNSAEDMGINCEPTNLEEMNIAGKGVYRYEVKIKGKGAFGGRPYQGISAIDKASRFIQAIMEKFEELKADTASHHPLLDPPSIQVTMIEGGEAPNLVPDTCTCVVTRRVIPGETKESCLEEINEILAKLSEEDPEFKASINLKWNFRPPVDLSPDLKVVNVFKRAHKLVRGTEMKLTGSEGGTDGTLVVAYAGLPMPVYGPGDYRTLGSVNEYLDLEDLIDAVKIYALSIYYMLGTE